MFKHCIQLNRHLGHNFRQLFYFLWQTRKGSLKVKDMKPR